MTIPPIINIIQSSSLTSPVISVSLSGSVNAAASPLLTSQSIPTVVVTMHDALTSVANFANSATSASVAQTAFGGSGSFTGSFQGALIGSASGNFLGTSNTTGSLLGAHSGSFTGSIAAIGSLLGAFSGISNATGSWTGSFAGAVVATSLSASLATPSSILATTAVSASFATTAVSASFATTASFATNAATGVYVPLSGSSLISGSVTIGEPQTANMLTVNSIANAGNIRMAGSGSRIIWQWDNQDVFAVLTDGGDQSFTFYDMISGSIPLRLIGSFPTNNSQGAYPYLDTRGNIYFNSDNTYDIGDSSGRRPRNVNVGGYLSVSTSPSAVSYIYFGGSSSGRYIRFQDDHVEWNWTHDNVHENWQWLASGQNAMTYAWNQGLALWSSGSHSRALILNVATFDSFSIMPQPRANENASCFIIGTPDVPTNDGTSWNAGDLYIQAGQGSTTSSIDGQIHLRTSGSDQLMIDNHGNVFIPNNVNVGALQLTGGVSMSVDNTWDIGTSSNGRARNLYIANAVNIGGTSNVGGASEQFINNWDARIGRNFYVNLDATINNNLHCVNIVPDVNSATLFQITTANQGAKPFQMDVNAQHQSLYIGFSPSGSGVYMTHGCQVTGGPLITDTLEVLGTAIVAGIDQSTSGWTSIPLRPGQPTSNANDAAGLDLILEGGQGTGVGARAGIQFQVGWATGSGTQGLHPLQTGMYLTSGSLIVSGTMNMLVSKTPTSTTDTSGQIGDIARDDNFIYVKTSAGWKRAALSTF